MDALVGGRNLAWKTMVLEWSKFQKMAPETSDIRKVDVAKMMLGRLVSDIVTFDPDMIPLRRKVIHKWGAAPFTNPVSEFLWQSLIKSYRGGPKKWQNAEFCRLL